MPPDIAVRQATPQDASDIAVIRVESWRATYPGLVPQAYLDRLSAADEVGRRALTLAGPPPLRFTLVAERAGVVVGFASGGPDRDTQEGRGELYAIYVQPAHLGIGAGAALMTTALAALHASFDAVGVWVLESNARARRFYERFGLAPTGERRVLDLDGPVPEVRHAGTVAAHDEEGGSA